MARLRPLVFDLDGTLIDSRRDIAAACNHALRAVGRSELPIEEITCHVGSGARKLLQGVLGEEWESQNVEELLRHFQAYYLERPTEHNSFMPGAEAALTLRGERKVALCTNKPFHLTEAVLQKLGWSEKFDAVVAPHPGDAVKPQPDLLLRVAEMLSEDPAHLVMIGDSPQDVGAGKAAGALTVGVKGGFLPLQRLIEAAPDALLESLEDLPGFLESI